MDSSDRYDFSGNYGYAIPVIKKIKIIWPYQLQIWTAVSDRSMNGGPSTLTNLLILRFTGNLINILFSWTTRGLWIIYRLFLEFAGLQQIQQTMGTLNSVH